MKKRNYTRRKFIASVSAGSLGALASGAIPVLGKTTGDSGKLAILGGTPQLRQRYSRNGHM